MSEYGKILVAVDLTDQSDPVVDRALALARLTGANGAGIWTIKVVDTSRGDVGTLKYVRIACS